MSVRVSSRVWESSAQSGGGLLMLLAIADFADDEGVAFPAVATLAARCRITVRSAHRLIAELRASGELVVASGAGPRGANVYRIVVRAARRTPDAGVTPDAHDRMTGASRTPDAGVTAPLTTPPLTPDARVTRTISEPSVNHQRTGDAREAVPTEPVDNGAAAAVGDAELQTVAILLRGAGVRVGGAEPELAALAGAPEADVLAAVELARQGRQAAGSTQPIGIRYVAALLERVRQRAGAAPTQAWWSSEQAMLAKGAELGLSPWPGEDWGAFKGRIRGALGRAA